MLGVALDSLDVATVATAAVVLVAAPVAVAGVFCQCC